MSKLWSLFKQTVECDSTAINKEVGLYIDAGMAIVKWRAKSDRIVMYSMLSFLRDWQNFSLSESVSLLVVSDSLRSPGP